MNIINIKTITQSFFLLAFSVIIACNNSDPRPGKKASDIDTTSQKNSTTAQALAYKLEKDTGYGYKVLVNNKVYINQNEIPAIQGLKRFTTQEDAQKVGDWVADQIKKGEPFGVSEPLLKQLGIKY